MEGSLSDAQVHTWLQHVADKSFISLHFQSPALGGSAMGEIAGGGYRRFKMSWHQPQNRSIWSLEDAQFTGLKPTRVTFFGVWDSLNIGMLRGYGELPTPAVIASGKGYNLPAGQIVISLG